MAPFGRHGGPSPPLGRPLGSTLAAPAVSPRAHPRVCPLAGSGSPSRPLSVFFAMPLRAITQRPQATPTACTLARLGDDQPRSLRLPQARHEAASHRSHRIACWLGLSSAPHHLCARPDHSSYLNAPTARLGAFATHQPVSRLDVQLPCYGIIRFRLRLPCCGSPLCPHQRLPKRCLAQVRVQVALAPPSTVQFCTSASREQGLVATLLGLRQTLAPTRADPSASSLRSSPLWCVISLSAGGTKRLRPLTREAP